MPIIQTEDLTYLYGVGTPFEKTALNHINLSIEEGEFVGVIGHTGSGKSTLLQHFNGLIKPSAGRVLIDGKDIWEKGANRQALRFSVGLVFQYPEYQIFEETVYKDVAFGPRNMGLSEKEVDIRVREAATFSGVEDSWLEKSPFALSGGQKRRVAIAGVLAMRPKVLILDEPAAGLDPRGRDAILDRICDYQRTQGTTVLLVSHSMEDIARIATRVLVMDKGSTAFYGDVSTVFSHAKELLSMGLDVPQITRVFMRLHEMGLPVQPSIYTVEQGKNEILRVLKERET
ncbi:MAG TPA: energy-coupling factor transporter ATPase [Ruminococcaceae bacterium]|nr:energy-coupling factor transporter ATPase [Oscillospiraceae bacterium]